MARMKNKIKLSDFSFLPSGHGHYQVTYTSPKTGKMWRVVTSNMPLIDATKNADEPMQVNLNILKRFVKFYGKKLK